MFASKPCSGVLVRAVSSFQLRDSSQRPCVKKKKYGGLNGPNFDIKVVAEENTHVKKKRHLKHDVSGHLHVCCSQVGQNGLLLIYVRDRWA